MAFGNPNSFLGNYGTGNSFLSSYGASTPPSTTSSPMQSTQNGPNMSATPPQNIGTGTQGALMSVMGKKAKSPVTSSPASSITPNQTSNQYKYNSQGFLTSIMGKPVNNPLINNSQVPNSTPTNPNAPITGNTTTPSGAVINATTGQMISGPTQQPPATAPAQTAPTTASLPGMLNTLASGKTAATAQADQSYQQAQAAQQDLTTSRMNEAKSLGDIGNSPIPLEFQQGRAAVLQGQYQAQQDAYAQQLAGESNLYGQAIGSQGQQLGAAGTAAGLSPDALRYGAFGASNLDPSTVAQQYAQRVQNGTMSPSDAATAMNQMYGGAGQTFLNQSLTPGFNYNTAAGNAAGQQQVAQTGGTAVQNSNVGVLNDAQQKYATYTNLSNNITNMGNQVISALSQSGINPTDSQWANKTLNQIASQFNSPQYAGLNAAIQGLRTRVAALINTGQDLGTASQASNDIVSGNMALGAMEASLGQINKEASTIVNDQGAIVESAKKSITGGNNYGSTNTNTGAGSTSTFSDPSYYGQ